MFTKRQCGVQVAVRGRICNSAGIISHNQLGQNPALLITPGNRRVEKIVTPGQDPFWQAFLFSIFNLLSPQGAQLSLRCFPGRLGPPGGAHVGL